MKKNMIKKTYKELREIDNIVGKAYQKNEVLEKSKFGYAYKRFSEKNFIPTVKKHNEQLADVRIDNALEDEKTKEILLDERPNSRGFKYNKEGLKKVMVAEKKLDEEFNVKEIEIEPFICKDVPNDFSEEEIKMMKGLVF